MAYKFNENAYYGDMGTPKELEDSLSRYRPHGSSSGGSSGGSSGSTDISNLDFSKITVTNAPWVKKQTLEDMVSDLTANPKTLNQTISLLDELISRLNQCATASTAIGG